MYREEKLLLAMLRDVAGKKNTADSSTDTVSNRYIGCDWKELVRLADSHAVTAMLYDALSRLETVPEHILSQVQKTGQITALSNYRLLFLTKYVTAYLKEHGILAVTLKGAVTASLYPVPEYRKSGDVDLLIPKEGDCGRAAKLLQQAGFQIKEHQSALHHIELSSSDGVSVELHSMLAEPFESQQMNQFLKKLLPEYETHVTENTAWGVQLYEPQEAYHGFYLLLHMLQHFLREGFGLKNLCDWTLFWNRKIAEAEKERFLVLIKESGTARFAGVLTAVCIRYLGLESGKAAFILAEPVREDIIQAFIQEVMDAGEFGKSEEDRMVALQGTGIAAYVQEFQHQMHLNYPKAGRVCFLWPLLWCLTLAKFLYNNRKLHRAPVRSILKKAGRRSRLTQQLRLFK